MTASWSTLDPWEKAAQWVEVAPELAGDVIVLARTYAEQRMRIENEQAEHRMRLEVAEAKHLRDMDIRLWYCQLGSLAINGLSLIVLLVIAISLGSDAAPLALAVAGANGGIAAAALAVTNSMRKSVKSREKVTAENATSPENVEDSIPAR